MWRYIIIFPERRGAAREYYINSVIYGLLGVYIL